MTPADSGRTWSGRDRAQDPDSLSDPGPSRSLYGVGRVLGDLIPAAVAIGQGMWRISDPTEYERTRKEATEARLARRTMQSD
jgi:hypothetical protein